MAEPLIGEIASPLLARVMRKVLPGEVGDGARICDTRLERGKSRQRSNATGVSVCARRVH